MKKNRKNKLNGKQEKKTFQTEKKNDNIYSLWK